MALDGRARLWLELGRMLDILTSYQFDESQIEIRASPFDLFLLLI